MGVLNQSSTVLVLGATGTLGEEITKQLASTKAHVVMIVRNVEKANAVIKKIQQTNSSANLSMELLDLSSLEAVYEIAHVLTKKYPKINCIINCATAVTFSPSHSVDGLELNWCVNVVAPFLLIYLLRDSLVAGGSQKHKSRVINLVSKVTMCSDLIEVDLSHILAPKDAYRFSPLNCFLLSKIEQRMVSYCLAKEWLQLPITVNCCHPGFVTSLSLRCLGFSKGLDALEDAIKTPLDLCLNEKYDTITGEYIENKNITKCPYKKDAKLPKVWNAILARLNGFVLAYKKDKTKMLFPQIVPVSENIAPGSNSHTKSAEKISSEEDQSLQVAALTGSPNVEHNFPANKSTNNSKKVHQEPITAKAV